MGWAPEAESWRTSKATKPLGIQAALYLGAQVGDQFQEQDPITSGKKP